MKFYNGDNDTFIAGEDSCTLSATVHSIYHQVKLFLFTEACVLHAICQGNDCRGVVHLSTSGESCAVLEGIGPVDNPRLLLKFDHMVSYAFQVHFVAVLKFNHMVSYAFQVHFVAVESGQYDEKPVRGRLDQLVPASGYVLCPGLRSIQPSDCHTLSFFGLKWRSDGWIDLSPGHKT